MDGFPQYVLQESKERTFGPFWSILGQFSTTCCMVTMATQNLRLLFFEILHLGLLKNDFIANSEKSWKSSCYTLSKNRSLVKCEDHLLPRRSVIGQKGKSGQPATHRIHNENYEGCVILTPFSCRPWKYPSNTTSQAHTCKKSGSTTYTHRHSETHTPTYTHTHSHTHTHTHTQWHMADTHTNKHPYSHTMIL